MSLPSWTNQWPFISFRIKYKWLSLASKVHPDYPGCFVSTFQHEPLTPLRLEPLPQPRFGTNTPSPVPLFVVIFPSGSILNLFPYTCKFSYPSISGLRPYQFPSSGFSTLFSQPLYFTFYHILLIFKTLFKNIRLPIHIELSSNIQQYEVLQKYGIIYTQTNSLFFLNFSDLIVNKWW